MEAAIDLRTDELSELSREIAELKLLPAIRKASSSTELAISGFSCRSQVKHFTGRDSKHPVEIVAEHLKQN